MTAQERFNNRTAAEIEVSFVTSRTTYMPREGEPIEVTFYVPGVKRRLKIWMDGREATGLGKQLLHHAENCEVDEKKQKEAQKEQ